MNNVETQGRFPNGCVKIDLNTVKNTDITRDELVALVALTSFADKNGYCYPSYNAIANRMRCSKSFAIKTIRKIAEKGLIKIITRLQEGSNESDTNGYYIVPSYEIEKTAKENAIYFAEKDKVNMPRGQKSKEVRALNSLKQKTKEFSVETSEELVTFTKRHTLLLEKGIQIDYKRDGKTLESMDQLTFELALGRMEKSWDSIRFKSFSYLKKCYDSIVLEKQQAENKFQEDINQEIKQHEQWCEENKEEIEAKNKQVQDIRSTNDYCERNKKIRMMLLGINSEEEYDLYMQDIREQDKNLEYKQIQTPETSAFVAHY